MRTPGERMTEPLAATPPTGSGGSGWPRATPRRREWRGNLLGFAPMDVRERLA